MLDFLQNFDSSQVILVQNQDQLENKFPRHVNFTVLYTRTVKDFTQERSAYCPLLENEMLKKEISYNNSAIALYLHHMLIPFLLLKMIVDDFDFVIALCKDKQFC